MFKTKVCVTLAAVVALCSLCGCPNESPQTTGTVSPAAPVTSKQSTESQTGEALFRQFCFNCHPDGGNISDHEKALHGAALRRNYISKPEDIVKIMRKPMFRMLPFDEKAISNEDARKIAEYVLITFK